MNARLALYLTGAAYLVRHHTAKGRRVPVLDRTKRWRSAARAMRSAGRTDLEIVTALGCNRQALALVLAFNFRL